MAKAIAITNQKGGVGKTTTAVNLTAALHAQGKTVLLCDFDPQANASSGLGYRKRRQGGIYPVLLGQAPAEEAIVSTLYGDLLPSSPELSGAGVELVSMDRREYRLLDALAPVRDRYDYIFIDCPPSLNILTLNAFCASDGVIIPMQCEYFALEGISVILRMIDKLREAGAAPALAVEGIVMTMYDVRTNLSRQVTDEIKTHFPQALYSTLIPRSVRLAEAPSHGQSVLAYAPDSTGAAAYRKLAREFLKRRAAKDPAHA